MDQADQHQPPIKLELDLTIREFVQPSSKNIASSMQIFVHSRHRVSSLDLVDCLLVGWLTPHQRFYLSTGVLRPGNAGKP